MQFLNTDLPGVILIEPKVFADERGFFMETYHQPRFAAAGIDLPFAQDNHSRSRKGVLRGLHFQLRHPQGKLVRAVQGEIFDVAVDVRRSSPTFGRWVGTILSDANRRQMYVPPGFAHGFCVVSETAEVLYKTTDVYQPQDERSVIWNDPSIGIEWPVKAPIVSDKDQSAPFLNDAECFD
ncbi:MAG: dTDP-4-dehydrorhamnose 3,5-epimerase [Planctomycetaceae bacterium]|nr:dTDP-4-dehydrorhamnose 3,5-epimerase [Planctomycetaceae bacterium]